uniref:COMM domain-containing protein 4 n=1 Tax=Magallana gigas TaxID=29159 RepID=K1PDI5_MAGGI
MIFIFSTSAIDHLLANFRFRVKPPPLQSGATPGAVFPGEITNSRISIGRVLELHFRGPGFKRQQRQYAAKSIKHATSLCKSYSDSSDRLQAHLRTTSLRLSHLEKTEWRVDYILSSSELKEVNEPCVQMKLHVRNPDSGTTTPVSFTVDMDKFRILLNAAQQAQWVRVL